jgi:3-isopropylmalate/(R)-2-methylmalate dehydratase large subunit
MRAGSRRHGIRIFDLGDPEQGISHVVAPELGMVLPGATHAVPDSHACTVGGLGALAFAVGTTELEHVLATQVLATRRPQRMRIRLEGTLGEHVGAKDVALRIIAEIGIAGARGHAVEYAGATVRADPDATFDQDIAIECGELAPQITWGTDPSQVIPVTGRLPDPEAAAPERRAAMRRALDYMGLSAGTPIAGLPVDRVFIGSCTNARLPDLMAAAAVARGRRVARGVVAMVVPGSSTVKRGAKAAGLDRVFRDAGFFWGESGCSMCAGGNGDRGKPGERCVSTTNRNFENRQGADVRTHLVGPAMAAAAAVAGRIVDVRRLAEAV